jgi:hypothetical protein
MRSSPEKKKPEFPPRGESGLLNQKSQTICLACSSVMRRCRGFGARCDRACSHYACGYQQCVRRYHGRTRRAACTGCGATSGTAGCFFASSKYNRRERRDYQTQSQLFHCCPLGTAPTRKSDLDRNYAGEKP